MNRFLSLACCAALMISGCGSTDPAVTPQEEQLGAEQHPQLLAQFGGAYAGDEADYLERMGERVASAAGLDGQCTFTLVNTDVVNAFAVPGCYIYVTRGLMGIINSEAELISVLAHEVGHITSNHNERQQRRSLFRGLGVAAISVLTGSERLSKMAGAAAGYFTLRYSRKHEYEADDRGLAYLRELGYDPYAAAGMLSALARHQQYLTSSRGRDEANRIPEWALTHPLTENRIARITAAAQSLGVRPNQLPENEGAYMRTLDGLLYGDDPLQGFVTGRRFAHPVMRIGFEAPTGFTLTNSPQAIMIEGPDGLQGEFSGGPMPAGGLPVYAENLIAELLRGATVELAPATLAMVNGVPSLLLPAVVRTQEGPVSISLMVYQGSGSSAYHFFIVSKPGAVPTSALGELFASFRLLGPDEVASLRARRIRTVQAGPGDTVARLAARMATDSPLAHFRMLNGLSAADTLRPGDLVKIVTTVPLE
jgi:predicted Zn-dependent protease